MTIEENIKVLVRIRPNFDDDGENNLSKYKDSNSINIPCKYEIKSFSYDKVADESSTQEDIFDSCKSLFESFFTGYNSTLFAYGQTSSGKTHTMTGDKNNPGLIPQGLQFIFDQIRENKEANIEYLVKCSFVEIYNENLFDLLDPSGKRVHLKKNLSQGFYVDRLTEEVIENTKKALEILHAGCCNRHVASTAMNRESSRSHSVFSIILECCEIKDDIKNIRKSVLHLVDLAGSERQKYTNSEGTTLKEAGSINKSLHVLGQVISALVDRANGKQRYIRYSESKLTKLLKDSIGGNSKTLLIACIHPDIKYTNETLSTLQFASNVKKIKNVAKVNIDVSGCVESLQKEVLMLREQLRRRSLNLFIRDDDYNSDSLWQNRFVQAMLLRSKLVTENCYLKEKFLQNNEADSVGNMRKIANLQAELDALHLNLIEAKNTESAIIAGLYKDYNDFISSGNGHNEKLSGNEIELAKLKEKLLEANLLIKQLQQQNASIENTRKEEQRKLESEIASMKKVLKQNDEEKESAVNRRQTMIVRNMDRLISVDNKFINCKRRNTKTSLIPNDENNIPEELVANEEFTIESLTNDFKKAEARNKEHIRYIGKLEYDIKAKEKDISELKKSVEDKDKIEMNFNELKEKLNSMEIDLRTNTELVRKYENQIKELNIDKSKSVKALNEQISNLEKDLDDALSERDSFKNELEIVKISKDFLNGEIHKKIDSSFKQENDDDQIKNAEILKKYENQIKELQDKNNQLICDLAESYSLYQDLNSTHDNCDEEIMDLEERIIEQDEEINDLKDRLSSESAKYENYPILLEKNDKLENNAKENEKKIIDLVEKLEDKKKTINDRENEILDYKKIIEGKENVINKLINDFEIERKFIQDSNVKNHLEEIDCLTKIMEKDKEDICNLQEELNCQKEKLETIKLALKDIFVKAEIELNSLPESIKLLDVYIDSKIVYIKRLSAELNTSNETKSLLKDEYNAIFAKFDHVNYKQKIKVLNKVKDDLYNSRQENTELLTKIARIRVLLVNCDQQTRDLILREIGPN